jgi:membrane fusion protein, copper/silver efflux system
MARFIKAWRERQMRKRFANLAATLLLVGVSGMAAGEISLPGRLLGQYFLIQKNLASDSIEGVSATVARIAEISRRAAASETHARTHLIALANAAAKLRASDLKSARNGFGELSNSLIAFLQATQAKTNPPYQFYCPMVKKYWLQPATEVRNPYYGSSMLKCGELVQSFRAGGQPTGHNNH